MAGLYFDELSFDAITLHPYLGKEALAPLVYGIFIGTDFSHEIKSFVVFKSACVTII